MAFTPEDLGYLNQRHHALEHGSSFTILDLMGDRWAEIGGPGQKRSFATKYSREVTSRTFEGIEFIGIRPNGRINLYQKT